MFDTFTGCTRIDTTYGVHMLHSGCLATHLAPSIHVVVCDRRVHFVQEQPCLTASCLSDNVARHWKPGLKYLLEKETERGREKGRGGGGEVEEEKEGEEERRGGRGDRRGNVGILRHVL